MVDAAGQRERRRALCLLVCDGEPPHVRLKRTHLWKGGWAQEGGGVVAHFESRASGFTPAGAFVRPPLTRGQRGPRSRNL